jgi:hypothetical protein
VTTETTTEGGTATTTEGGTTTTTDGGTATTTTVEPTWRDTLPDDLKNDATLSKYADLETFARGHLETKRLASSKVIVPGEGATEDDWGAFYKAIGRPEDPDAYDIKTIELPVDASDEERTALAEATKPFKALAHKLGLTPAQATALSEFDLQRTADFYAKGEEEIAALKDQLKGDYAPKLEAGRNAFAQLFGNDPEAIQLAAELDRKVGSGRIVKAMMRLGEVMGEARLIDNDKVEGFGEVGNADAKIDELQKDKAWREKFTAGDPTTVNQYNRLLDLAKRQALRGTRQA